LLPGPLRRGRPRRVGRGRPTSTLRRYREVLPALAAQVLAEQHDLPDVVRVVVVGREQRVDDQALLPPDRDRREQVPRGEVGGRGEQRLPARVPLGQQLGGAQRRGREL